MKLRQLGVAVLLPYAALLLEDLGQLLDRLSLEAIQGHQTVAELATKYESPDPDCGLEAFIERLWRSLKYEPSLPPPFPLSSPLSSPHSSPHSYCISIYRSVDFLT